MAHHLTTNNTNSSTINPTNNTNNSTIGPTTNSTNNRNRECLNEGRRKERMTTQNRPRLLLR